MSGWRRRYSQDRAVRAPRSGRGGNFGDTLLLLERDRFVGLELLERARDGRMGHNRQKGSFQLRLDSQCAAGRHSGPFVERRVCRGIDKPARMLCKGAAHTEPHPEEAAP